VAAVDLVALSRTLSHALRHAPHQYELELDDEGWVPLPAVLDALRADRDGWAAVEVDDLRQMMAAATKQRFELDEDAGRIRARYGHSVPGKLLRVIAEPPALLWHGTAPSVAEVILQGGLRPMGRQYVHLSVDTATALEVGRRKGARPVLLRVLAAEAHRAAVAFYAGNDKVWLADAVPPSFIERA
jgi:putative RNA 2'-phosphotransferase